MTKILIASNNQHKLREIKTILAGLAVTLVTPQEIGLNELIPEEYGATYEANALQKARAFAQASHLPTLADDSGVETEVFPHFPGVHSARWHPGSDAKRTTALLQKMSGQKNRSFTYITVLAFVDLDQKIEKTFSGQLTGQMALEASSGEGFGYDPIMIPSGYNQTLAQLGDDVKNNISHRRQALNKFKAWLMQKYV